MTPSAAIATFIKSFEGCRNRSYQDISGKWTIGYGHTGSDVGPGDYWPQDKCELVFNQDLAEFGKLVAGLLVLSNTTQYEFDAIVSLAYNVGITAVMDSTLRKMHNSGNPYKTVYQFLEWDHAGHSELLGLLKRRAQEAIIYSNGAYPYANTN